MSYFHADEQLEQTGGTLPAPWGLRGTVRRAANVVELELDWQRPRVPLDSFSVVLVSNPHPASPASGRGGIGSAITGGEGETMEIASVAGSATHCRATLPLDGATTSLSVVVVARHGPLCSAPSAALTLQLSPLPLPLISAQAPPQIVAAPSLAPTVSAAAPQVVLELVDDLAAIDAALGQAEAHLGKNGVFVRFKPQA